MKALAFIFIFCFGHIIAQPMLLDTESDIQFLEADSNYTNEHKKLDFENINCDKRFRTLLSKRIVYHEQNPFVEGYRVQLRKSTSMEELMALRSRFLELFPNEFILIEDNLPYFLLRIGNHVGVWGIWEAKLHAELLKRYFDRAVYVRTSIYIDHLIEKDSNDEEQD